ncbi:MAG TPA: hypothetical protein VHC69_34640 [Polyangiaceae bacterium]|nr:hypothetical protein [Polyangiaceae bacterium]
MASRFSKSKATVLLAAVATCATAHAEETRSEQHALHWNAEPPQETRADSVGQAEPAKPTAAAAGALDDGQLDPFTIGAPAARGVASVKTLGGYDSASKSGAVRSAVDASVTKWLALRLEYEHGPGTGSDDRVTVGARVVLLNEKKHSIDGGFGFFYDAKDFRNEGNFIGMLLVGRHFGRLNLYGNALFGMDSEGDDQAVELRAGTGYRLSPMLELGFDSRGRVNMSEDSKRANAQAINWELQATPTAALSFGPIALLASVGPSFLNVTEPGAAKGHLDSGVLALGGVGGAF